MRVVANGKLYETTKLRELQGADERYDNGVALIGVYKTKSGVLVVTNSIWQAQDGGCVGIKAHLATETEIAWLAERYRGDLLDLLPEGEA